MTPEERDSGEHAHHHQPDYDGDTYVTSKRAPIGVGNEPPVVDVEERRRQWQREHPHEE